MLCIAGANLPSDPSRQAIVVLGPRARRSGHAQLFDMLISCASIQGISWLEAAGAVHAENQVLRLISDRAGLPDSAGGCFVSGGSA
jgi:glutamate/tyrosine decarboxylase-like PLP-dependent enzyme